MRPTLTEKQANALQAIALHVEEYGYPPSVRQLCELIGVASTSTAQSHLESLRLKGYLEHPHGNDQVRAYRIVGAELTLGLPDDVREAITNAHAWTPGW